jgi:hypothetical protein
VAKFATADGREWTLGLTVGALGDLKRDAGFDVGAAMKTGDALAVAIFGDVEQFAGALWVLVRDQAAAVGVDRDVFYRALDPASLDRAADAFVECLVDFFHRRRAPAIQAELPALLARVDERHAEAVRAAANAALTKSAGDSPGSLDSTPAG